MQAEHQAELERQGLAFGPGRRLSREESAKNLVLLAPTGSGKTTRHVIPNLLQLHGSVVVPDPSGEIFAPSFVLSTPSAEVLDEPNNKVTSRYTPFG